MCDLCKFFAQRLRRNYDFSSEFNALDFSFLQERCAVALEISKSSINSAMLMNSFSRISEWLMVKRFNGMVGPI